VWGKCRLPRRNHAMSVRRLRRAVFCRRVLHRCPTNTERAPIRFFFAALTMMTRDIATPDAAEKAGHACSPDMKRRESAADLLRQRLKSPRPASMPTRANARRRALYDVRTFDAPARAARAMPGMSRAICCRLQSRRALAQYGASMKRAQHETCAATSVRSDVSPRVRVRACCGRKRASR